MLIYADLHVVLTDGALPVVTIYTELECSACNQWYVYTRNARISLHEVYKIFERHCVLKTD